MVLAAQQDADRLAIERGLQRLQAAGEALGGHQSLHGPMPCETCMLSPVAGELEQVAAAGWPWAARAIGSHALVIGDDSIDPVDASMLGRAPQRITITLPHHVYKQIAQRSIAEGRSISNLAAYLLERAVFG